MEAQSEKPVLLNNRYQLNESLGTGGMAKVFLSRDLMLERNVAVKILKQELSRDETFRIRFRQEARSAANLSHPNIVTVHDFGFYKGRLFIVMEYVPGKNLKDIMSQYRTFSIKDTIHLIKQACDGIGYAHRAGLVHCDLKPHNMLVAPDQRLKVTDFGIARALSSIKADERSDVVWGSPQYFSPEQAAGLPPSPASDVYSLGVILYEMLTGQLPFYSDDPVELARMHREEIPQPPSELNPDIPPELEQIMLKVLSKEPAGRYRTTDQLGRILETFRDRFLNESTIEHLSNGQRNHKKPNTNEVKQPQYRSENGIRRNSYHQNEDPEILEKSSFDWQTILLGIAALLAVSGLVPFWIFIWFRINAF